MLYLVEVDGPTGTECPDCGELHTESTVQLKADSPEGAKAQLRADPRMHEWMTIEAVRPVHDARPSGEPDGGYICQCDCGNLIQATGEQLRSGEVRSCGVCRP